MTDGEPAARSPSAGRRSCRAAASSKGDPVTGPRGHDGWALASRDLGLGGVADTMALGVGQHARRATPAGSDLAGISRGCAPRVGVRLQLDAIRAPPATSSDCGAVGRPLAQRLRRVARAPRTSASPSRWRTTARGVEGVRQRCCTLSGGRARHRARVRLATRGARFRRPPDGSCRYRAARASPYERGCRPGRLARRARGRRA